MGGPHGDKRGVGRPLSPELSDRVLTAAVDLLAEAGWRQLSPDRVCARAKAGKASLYRRWANMSALARDALRRCTLVECPEDTGDLRGDLCALLRPWCRELNRCERAAASLIGAERHDHQLQMVLEESLLQPLTAVVCQLWEREKVRALSASSCELAPRPDVLISVLQALYWRRFADLPTTPLSAAEIEQLVDVVLMPIAGLPDGSSRPSGTSL